MIEKYKTLEAKNAHHKTKHGAYMMALTVIRESTKTQKENLNTTMKTIAELTRQHEAYIKILGELLAVLHANNRHYQYEHGTEKAVADAITKHYELVKQLAEHKADAAKWRAYQKRKQEVIAAGMGRKILRDLETHDALPAFYAAMKGATE